MRWTRTLNRDIEYDWPYLRQVADLTVVGEVNLSTNVFFSFFKEILTAMNWITTVDTQMWSTEIYIHTDWSVCRWSVISIQHLNIESVDLVMRTILFNVDDNRNYIKVWIHIYDSVLMWLCGKLWCELFVITLKC